MRTEAIRVAADAVEACAQVVGSLAATARALEASAKALRQVAEASSSDGAYTLTGAASQLGVSRGYVRKLIKGGQLVAERHGDRVWRVPFSALAAYRRRLQRSGV